jgi:hypothetical protein
MRTAAGGWRLYLKSIRTIFCAPDGGRQPYRPWDTEINVFAIPGRRFGARHARLPSSTAAGAHSATHGTPKVRGSLLP